MSQPYRQLVLDERRTIFRLLNAKLPIDAIAKEIGRHRSTLCREIRRNRFNDVKEYRGYYPVTADDSARARRQRQRKLVRDASLRACVLEKLALWWSPEQIAGRLRRGGMIGRVCHETIYQFVYGPEGRSLGLHRHLLRARRLRRRRFGRRPHSPKIPPERTITFDRGSELLGYDHLTGALGIDSCLCDPHAPWQKGRIENTNGRHVASCQARPMAPP